MKYPFAWIGAFIAVCTFSFCSGLAIGRHQWSQQNAVFSLWIAKNINEIKDPAKADMFIRETARMYFEILNDPISYRSLFFPYKPSEIQRSPKDLDKISHELISLLKPPFENYTDKDITSFVHTRLLKKPAPSFSLLNAEQGAAANP